MFGDDLKPKDGGQAFPSVAGADDAIYDGMSLRDWFAAQALVGMIGTAAVPALSGFNGAEATIARAAYAMSDAMLVARRDS